LMVCFFVCRPEFSHPGTFAQPRAGLQIFAFYPVIVAILQGQDSILLLVGFCAVYRFLVSGHRALAGLALGLMIFKFQIVIPIVAFLLVRYANAALFLGFASGSALVGGLSIASVGWRGFVSFTRALRLTNSAALARNAPHAVLGVTPRAMPNLKGLLSALAMDRLPGSVLFLLTLTLSAVIALWIARKLKTCKPGPELSYSIATSGALLLSYYLHLQDLAALLVPFGLFATTRNATVRKATWLFYAASPLVVMFGPGAIFLLSLLLMMFLYGLIQLAEFGGSSGEGAIASAPV